MILINRVCIIMYRECIKTISKLKNNKQNIINTSNYSDIDLSKNRYFFKFITECHKKMLLLTK